jgi:hypothetical protein
MDLTGPGTEHEEYALFGSQEVAMLNEEEDYFTGLPATLLDQLGYKFEDHSSILNNDFPEVGIREFGSFWGTGPVCYDLGSRWRRRDARIS